MCYWKFIVCVHFNAYSEGETRKLIVALMCGVLLILYLESNAVPAIIDFLEYDFVTFWENL